MRFGISVPNFAEPGDLVDLARRVEAAAWDGFFLWDHIVVDRSSPPPISDPWTVLAAAAVATTTVRLGTLVTPVPRRRPWVLARQVGTVDHLSGGRAVLGVGLGVPPEQEYGSFGEPSDPSVHGRMLDEGLDVIDALWSGAAVDYHGTHYDVSGVRFEPRPVQRPRVPIWCAATLPAHAGVRRAARWDGIAPIYSAGDLFRPVTPDEVAAIVGVLDAAGRADRFDVVVWALAPDEDQRRSYSRAGATWLIEGPAPGPDWLDDARAIAQEGPPVR